MKRKRLVGIFAMTAIMLALTSCGTKTDVIIDGEVTDEMQESTESLEDIVEDAELPDETEPEVVLTATQQAILDYELKYNKGEFAAEDYLALADLYREQGLIRRQRDMLEAAFRLYGDEQAYATLQTLTVNLAEEDEEIQAQAALMLQNLELEEYLNESVNLIAAKEWFATMMPKMRQGKRSYFLERDGQPVLLVEAGYDEGGKAYSDVWYLGEKTKVLRHGNGTVQMLVTTMADGVYQGEFESWLCDSLTGDIYHEKGTFANGVLTGDYTMEVHEGKEGSDLFALWSNREGMEYTSYTGHFDEQGMTTLEQPVAKKIKKLVKNTDFATCVVYAYDAKKKNCLFEGLADGVDSDAFAFGIEAMGWKQMPVFTAYAVQPDVSSLLENGLKGDVSEDTADTVDTVDVSALQVRVYDGRIQMLVNGIWVDMGEAKEYAEADPFAAYAEKEIVWEEQDGGVPAQNRPVRKPVTASVPKDEVVVTKPVTPAPTPTPEPTPEPEPTPAPTPAPAPAPSPAPTPTPEPTPTPPAEDSSNETDIEWTPDLALP